MPFGTIVAQTVSYEPRTPGVYSKAGLSFTDPQDEFRIRGGSAGKGGQTTATVTRVKQVDVTVGSSIERRVAVVSQQIQAPTSGGVTATVIDSMATDISEFLTSSTISRLLQGEN